MTRRTRVPTEFRRPGTAAARLRARPPMIMAEYAYELRKSGQKRPKCCEVAPNLPDSDNITSVRVNQLASRGSGPLRERIAHMRTTAITALLAVGVLAAAGTDCTDEALPGESPFTKAPTIASLALLATTNPSARNALNYAAAPNSLIGGGVSAPVTASANSGPALIGVTFAFNTVSAGAVTQNGGNGADGAAAAPNSLIGGGVSAPVTASANSGPALIGVTFAFNTVSAGAVTQNGGNGADGAAAAPNSLIGGGVSAPVTASANSGPALIGVTFAFNAVSAGAVTQNGGNGADGAAAAPNSLIGGGVSAPVTASANSGPALIGVTFAFNTVSAGAVTQNGGNGADGAAAAPNSLIGGGVSAPVTASANSGPALIGVTFAFNAVSAGAVTQNGGNGADGAAAAPNSLIGGGVSAPVTASANSGPALIGVTFAFNAVSAGAVTQNGGNGADGAAAAPNSLIGGGVSAPVTASANSGPALIGVTFAFNAVSAGAVTQNGGNGADGAAAAPNSLIGGGVSAPVTASANSGPALIGVTFAFNAVSAGAVTQNGGRGRRRRRGTQLAHRRRRICTGYGVCEQRPGPDRSDLCV